MVDGSHFASHGTSRSLFVRTIERASEPGPLVRRQPVTIRLVGLPDDQRDAFIDAYGPNIRSWGGHPVLRDIREFSTLTALVRQGKADARCRQDLRIRLQSLRTGDAEPSTAFWRPSLTFLDKLIFAVFALVSMGVWAGLRITHVSAWGRSGRARRSL